MTHQAVMYVPGASQQVWQHVCQFSLSGQSYRPGAIHIPMYSARPCPEPSRPWRLGSRRQPRIVASLPSKRDILVLDATNVLAIAAADRSRMAAIKGYNLRAAFADWVAYLALLTEPTLTIACFDAPKAQRAGPGQRAGLAQSYLQRRRRQVESRAAAASDAGGRGGRQAAAPGGGLHPFLQCMKEMGALSLAADGGWEADDCVAATCSLIQGAHPSLSIAVASGDSDMQQLLAPNVSWLHLLPAPSLEHPLGVEWVTAEGFQHQHGFLPEAYPDWLAFVGKKVSSIGGVGTGAGTAAKLLKRYGSIQGIEAAAARGELAGWSSAVQRLFCGRDEAQRQLLQRNRELFAMNTCPDAMLGEVQQGEILERATQAAAAKAGGTPTVGHGISISSCSAREEGAGSPAGSVAGPGRPAAGGAAAELTWKYPLHASRWQHNQACVESLAAWLRLRGAAVEARAVTPSGLAVDLLVREEGAHLLGAGSAPLALLVAGLCDFQLGAALARAPEAAAGAAAAGAELELVDAAGRSGAVLRQLVGAVQLHARQLKKEGLQVVCVPWWRVPQT